MAKKKNPHIRLAYVSDVENLKARAMKRRRSRRRRWIIAAVLILMILSGTYLLIKNQSYTNIHEAAAYTE